MLTRLAMRDNSTRARADQAFYELAYPNHPYAIDEEGYPETIRAITRDDLVDFHRRHFGPRGMILYHRRRGARRRPWRWWSASSAIGKIPASPEPSCRP